MNLTGEPISAEEAYELGLAGRLVPTTNCSTPPVLGAQAGRAGAAGRRADQARVGPR